MLASWFLMKSSQLWDDANKLLNEMLTNRVSNIHQVMGQMIKGDYDDESNWQMVEYVFDKLKSEGCGLGMRFYNTLIEALWWLGQKQRAVRVLSEATQRGLFPELLRKNKLVWSIDVHRMWEGGAYAAMSLWLNNMYEMFLNGEDLPYVATVVVVRGKMEKNYTTQDLPVAKAAYSFLQDNMSGAFSFPKWNNGRILCQRSQLKKILSSIEPSTDGSSSKSICTLSNSPFPPPGTKTSPTDVDGVLYNGTTSDATSRTRTELLTSTV